MKRNKVEKFLTNDPKNVIVVLDGDQRNLAHSKVDNVYCIPVESIEKELLSRCLSGQFWEVEKLKKIIDDYDRLLDFINGKSGSKKSNFKVLLYKLILWLRKSTALRRQLSIATGELVKDKDFKKAGKKLFKDLVKNRHFTRYDIFEFIIKKNLGEMKTLCRDIEEFICLEVSQTEDVKFVKDLSPAAVNSPTNFLPMPDRTIK